MSIIVKAKVKDFAQLDGKSYNVSGDFAEKLAEKAETLIKEACQRAKANGRSTVMAKDL